MKASVFLKMLGILLFTFIGHSCSETICDCDYVTYEANPSNNYSWQETYRSTWDASCEDEFLNESVYTASDGKKWYSRTYIECE